jgi:hypothetical protein
VLRTFSQEEKTGSSNSIYTYINQSIKYLDLTYLSKPYFFIGNFDEETS